MHKGCRVDGEEGRIRIRYKYGLLYLYTFNVPSSLQLHLLGVDLLARLVVLVGPHEHHSNILPWREKAKKVVYIKETQTGRVDLTHLNQCIQEIRVGYMQIHTVNDMLYANHCHIH